jgi:hypothetical protein
MSCWRGGGVQEKLSSARMKLIALAASMPERIKASAKF